MKEGLCTSDVVVDVNVMMQKSKQVVELADRTADIFYQWFFSVKTHKFMNLCDFTEFLSPELIL